MAQQQVGRVSQERSDSIHLLVTDVVMPGMNGRELAEHLTARHRTMKVLYMSGYTEDTTIRYGVELGQTAFLQKPFTPDALLSKVRDMLEATTE